MIQNIVVPALGEGITDVSLIRWLVNIGDKVKAEQPIVEIATDKVDSEIISPYEGIITELLVTEGDIPLVGAPIAKIELTNNEDFPEEVTDEDFIPQNDTFIQEDSSFSNETQQIYQEETIIEEPISNTPQTIQNRFISPYIRTLAQQNNISFEELTKIKGSGENNRLTKNDILNYINNRAFSIIKQNNVPEESATVATVTGKQSHNMNGENSITQNFQTMRTEVIRMDRMRKLIAEHMVNSVHTSPHVTSFAETDVTHMVSWRNKVKNDFQKQYNQKLTFTPLIIEAVAKAIKEFPMINVSVDQDKIILKKDINIGMATALQNGNLIVPVIKHADELSMRSLAEQVNELADRARNNKLLPHEVKGGTFSITNLGSFGNTSGTPIINQPEVAILAVGVIQRKPAVVKTEYGESIGIRDIMELSLTYDHRVVDGALGGLFLKRISEILGNFDLNRKY